MSGYLQPITPTQVRAFGRINSIACIGDSIALGSAGAGGSFFENAWQRGAASFNRAGNFALAGKRTDEVLAVQVPQAIASGASHCVIQDGTNDISQSIAEATIRTNKIAQYAALRAAGVEPIRVSIFPNSAGNAVRHVAHAIWEKLYCLKNNIPYVDCFGVLASTQTDGTYLTANNLDNIHPTVQGANLAADLLNLRLANLYQWPILCALSDASADTDGRFFSHAISYPSETGSDIGTFGTGGAFSLTAADSGGVGKWLRTTLTAAVNAGWESRVGNTTTLGWAGGDKIAYGAFIRCIADPTNAITGVYAQFARSTMGATSLQGSGFIPGSTSQIVGVYGETTYTSGSQISMKFFGSGTGWFEVNRPICVNLTKLGF